MVSQGRFELPTFPLGGPSNSLMTLDYPSNHGDFKGY